MDPGESPGQKGVEEGEGEEERGKKKDILFGLCENYSKTKARGARGCERRNDNTRRWVRRTGREVCRRRRAFRMIDRTSYILTMADHR